MSDTLNIFDPLVAEWFAARFERPTEPQINGWREIAAGRDVLISAPTGSGKTLAAFLICLDQLVRLARLGPLSNETQVVYVSPLKALVQRRADATWRFRWPKSRNWRRSAASHSRRSERAVRTGDTPALGTAADGEGAAARSGDHAGIAVHPDDGRSGRARCCRPRAP